MYSDAILDALKRSGLEITEDIINPDTPEQTGVMVACDNPEEPSDSARAIIGVFKSADIDVTITNMLSQARNNGARGCILFIGPAPL
jgi:signal recognition particle subunit SEC65